MPATPELSERISQVLSRTLRRTASSFRQSLWPLRGALGVATGLLLLGSAAFTPSALWSGDVAVRVLSGCTLILLFTTLIRRLRRRREEVTVPWRRRLSRIETGGSLLVLTYALLQAVGGSQCSLHPLVYAVCAFLVSVHRARVAVILTAIALACEGALLYSEGVVHPERYAVHALLMCVFAALHWLLLRGELWRQRGEHQRRVEGAIASLEEQARAFRLMLADDSLRREGSSDDFDRGRAEALLLRGAVVELKENLRAVVDLLRGALHLHTCALLLLPEGDDRLRMVAGASASSAFRDLPVPLDAGVIGTVVKSGRLLNLNQPTPGQLPYYDASAESPEVAAFVGVPMLDGGDLCGVLCADRVRGPGQGPDDAPAPFTPAEEDLLLEAALLVLRSRQYERLFSAVERKRYENERLYRASSQLSRALTPEQVYASGFEALRQVCVFDFAALVAYDPEARLHEVLSVTGDRELCEATKGRRFHDNSGLCAMAVKNRAPLPPGGDFRDRETPVFDDTLRLRGYGSLLVVPLAVGSAIIGTLVVATRRSRAFETDLYDLLGVLANQLAVSLENAHRYKALEALATTDGLTGLANRRTFQERISEMQERSSRQRRPLTLIMADIDHFKRINDTYGHQIGDVVLRRVAQAMQVSVRKVDVAARYGGEEFAVLLEGTDPAGGQLYAERLRKEVEKLVFQSDKGSFTCTLSLGMATFPDDLNEGQPIAVLIEHADQALYFAKRNGRNQAVTYRDVAAALRSAA